MMFSSCSFALVTRSRGTHSFDSGVVLVLASMSVLRWGRCRELRSLSAPGALRSLASYQASFVFILGFSFAVVGSPNRFWGGYGWTPLVPEWKRRVGLVASRSVRLHIGRQVDSSGWLRIMTNDRELRCMWQHRVHASPTAFWHAPDGGHPQSRRKGRVDR